MTCRNYAIITVTENGLLLAQKLYTAWQNRTEDNFNINIYVKKERYKIDGLNQDVKVTEFDKMKDLIEKIFYEYEALILFTSTGIAVRMIAPYIVHKAKDPAVIVLDEQAHFTISLLSGHLGGANALTKDIAVILNSQPVITTATDVNNITAPDVLATELKLVPYPLSHIKIINAALVQKKGVNYYIDKNWDKADYYSKRLNNLGIKVTKIAARSLNRSYTPCVFISPQRCSMTNILILSPRRLIIGLGCRRNVSVTLIDKAIKNAVKMADCSDLKISKVVSTVVKSNEAGLLNWAKDNKVRTQFFDNEVMNKTIDKYNIAESAFVKKQIGIGNVCEAAILSYNEKAKIILPKTKFEKVTVSLGWE